MTTPANDAATAVAAAQRVKDQAAASSWRHGYVTEANPTTDVVSVLIDPATDPEDATPVLNRSGQLLTPGARVLVAQPPAGASYIIGTTAPQHRARCVLTGPDTPMTHNDLVVLPVDTITGDTDLLTLSGGAVVAGLTGVYDLDVMVSIEDDPSPAGHRYVEFLRNGTERILGPQGSPSPSGVTTRIQYRTTYPFDAGDTIEVRARQAQGATLDGTVARLVVIYDGA